MSEPAEIINDVPSLAKKAPVQPGRTADDILKLAEMRLQRLAVEFELELKKQVEKLMGLAGGLGPVAGDLGADVPRLRAILHELRGQGGTFGFPLVTDICDSAVRYIDPLAEVSARDVDMIQAHINALRAVVAGNIQGDGGPVGQELRRTLGIALQKMGGET